ncbi:MAG: TolC family outer membrane protein [Desulfofustis sp.]|jgi:adhesin transport system outer membrane protein
MIKKISRSALLACGLALALTAPSQGETIAEAVDQVIQTNPRVQSQIHNRLARDQEVVQARAGYYPTLDGYAAGGWANYREPIEDDLNPYEAGFSLRQNVFRGFADQGEVARQEARVASSAYLLQGTSEDLALETARVYINILRKQDLKEIADENLAIHLRIADQIKLRSDSGVGSQADTDQINGRLALAQSNVVIAETNLQDARSEYLAVVGTLPMGLTQPLPPNSRMFDSLEDATLAALGSNPILKSAAADLEARQQQYEVAKAPYYPILDIELDQRWDEDISLSEGERDWFSALGRVRYNFFNGFRDQGRKAETLEQVSEAREIKNNTERQVVESMRLSWMAYMSVLDRIDYLRNYMKSSRSTAIAYAKQFDIGKRTLLDVLDAEAEAITARADLVDAEADGLFAQYRMLAATGQLVDTFGLAWPEQAMVDEE